MDNNLEQIQTVVDIVDLVDKIYKINALLGEPDKKKIYELLVDIKLSYPLVISAVEIANGDGTICPYESFTIEKLMQKLRYFRKTLYLLGVGKGIEAYIKEEEV